MKEGRSFVSSCTGPKHSDGWRRLTRWKPDPKNWLWSLRNCYFAPNRSICWRVAPIVTRSEFSLWRCYSRESERAELPLQSFLCMTGWWCINLHTVRGNKLEQQSVLNFYSTLYIYICINVYILTNIYIKSFFPWTAINQTAYINIIFHK